MTNQPKTWPRTLARRWIDEFVEAMRRLTEDFRTRLPPGSNRFEPIDPRFFNALIVLGAIILAMIVYIAARNALLH